VHLCQEGRDVGCLMVVEVLVLFECGPRLGKESVVSFTFTLSLCFAFLLFRRFGRRISMDREWSFILGCVAMCSAAWLSVKRK
jgi:hypothetical protein